MTTGDEFSALRDEFWRHHTSEAVAEGAWVRFSERRGYTWLVLLHRACGGVRAP